MCDLRILETDLLPRACLTHDVSLMAGSRCSGMNLSFPFGCKVTLVRPVAFIMKNNEYTSR